MSASLVGSEMCIRDRDAASRARAQPSRQELLCQRAGRARGYFSWLDPFPVSYTHLTLPTICSV
eukprot:14404193-Alexandrium_andersonii.AAC.1